MRVHHLDCVTSCPLGGHLMDGCTSGVLRRGRLCCHCLLAETNQGLVLVDTGYGLNDVRNPRARLGGFFLALMGPDLREDMTAVRQVERLGFSASDVRHIVLTHLDFDHAGGLDDFPQATVHMLRTECDAAMERRTWLDRQRYRPQQWGTHANWRVYDVPFEGDWFGFDCVRDLAGLPPEILLVPLPGHTYGHAGVALRTDQGWLLQAGDAYFHHAEMDVARPRCTPGLRLYQWMMEKDRAARLRNQQRLRELVPAHGSAVRLCCAHDPLEFATLSGRSLSEALQSPVRPASAREESSSRVA
jgi:glyoxylase-like metal-dependent hydrolase (beta-lactamase superfamily II)